MSGSKTAKDFGLSNKVEKRITYIYIHLQDRDKFIYKMEAFYIFRLHEGFYSTVYFYILLLTHGEIQGHIKSHGDVEQLKPGQAQRTSSVVFH